MSYDRKIAAKYLVGSYYTGSKWRYFWWLQIIWLVSIWWGTLVDNGLNNMLEFLNIEIFLYKKNFFSSLFITLKIDESHFLS